MTTIRMSAALGLGLAALVGQVPGTTPGHAADPKEVSKDILAVQIRKQGYDCATPMSAVRGPDASDDDATWVLDCGGVSYKIQLIPDMAAHVERLPDQAKP